jgi:hypothetical protein
MSYRLDSIDFDKHNEEVKAVWEAYHARRPIRVPVILGITHGGRFILREANNLSPRTAVENVAAMYEAAREYGRYS